MHWIFFELPTKNYKFLITNNYILDKNFLDQEKELIIYDLNDNKHEINLQINRFKITDSSLDFTLIEILEEDNVNNFFKFLQIDEFINSKDYKNEEIFSYHFPNGKNIKYSVGKILEKNNNSNFIYSTENEELTSGSPIILKYNSKVIGIFKESYIDEQNTKLNKGMPFYFIFDKLNFIKCVYNVNNENLGKEIQILNSGYISDGKLYEMNKEIKYKIIILVEGQIKTNIFKYTFYTKGEHNVYLIQNSPLFNAEYLFYDCNSLVKINFSLFKTDKIKNMGDLFYRCYSLKEINLSSFKTDNVTCMINMFNGCSSLKKINLSTFRTDNVTILTNMFSDCSSLKEINISSFKTDNVKLMDGMFRGCSSLKVIDLSPFRTDKVTDMNSMFYGCSSLKEINLSSFKTDKVTGMSCMFSGCSSLERINISSFRTDNVTSMAYMFNNCSSLREINLLSFKTDNVIDMSGMFSGCSSLKEINLSSFKTDKVKYMNYMFSWSRSLKEINLSLFNANNVLEMKSMFTDVSNSSNLICSDYKIRENFPKSENNSKSECIIL